MTKNSLFRSTSVTLALASIFVSAACSRNNVGAKSTQATAAAKPAAVPPIGNSTKTNAAANPFSPSVRGSSSAPSADDLLSDNSQNGMAQSSASARVLDPSNLSSKEIFASSLALGPAKVGVKSARLDGDKNELFYSGAGQDELNESLSRAARIAPLSNQVKQANAEFALRVGMGDFSVDMNSKNISVSVAILHDGKRSMFTESGVLSNEREFVLGSTSSGDQVQINGQCLDADVASCSEIVATISDGRGGGTAPVAKLIIRKTAVAMIAEKSSAAESSGSLKLDRLFAYFRRAELGRSEQDTVRGSMLTTSETIGGSSSMVLVTQFNSGASGSRLEEWTWKSPLLKPAESTLLEMPIKMSEPRIFVSQCLTDSHTGLQDLISSALLTRNDGRGNLQFKLTFDKTNSSNGSSFTLTVARIHPQLRMLGRGVKAPLKPQ